MVFFGIMTSCHPTSRFRLWRISAELPLHSASHTRSKGARKQLVWGQKDKVSVPGLGNRPMQLIWGSETD